MVAKSARSTKVRMLTTPCRSELAREDGESNAQYQPVPVSVDDARVQAYACHSNKKAPSPGRGFYLQRVA
jgi:hypothetical protein